MRRASRAGIVLGRASSGGERASRDPNGFGASPSKYRLPGATVLTRLVSDGFVSAALDEPALDQSIAFGLMHSSRLRSTNPNAQSAPRRLSDKSDKLLGTGASQGGRQDACNVMLMQTRDKVVNDGLQAKKENVKGVVPFLRVAQMERSLRYYVEGLGFTIENTWEVDGKLRWCWLVLGGAALMLQEYPREGHCSSAPIGKMGEGVSLYFNCADAIAIYREVTACGIEATEPQVGNSMWETFLSDPDGYRVNFTSPTEVPEEVKLSEIQG
jgi:lactoylglutathione lyase